MKPAKEFKMKPAKKFKMKPAQQLLNKDLGMIADTLAVYCDEEISGALCVSWKRISELAQAGCDKASYPDPHLLTTLLDGMAGMICVGVEKGAINKASAKSMIALARKMSRKMAK